MSISASAESANDLFAIPDGQVVVHLDATESETVAQDLLDARLSVTVQNADATQAQDKVNAHMQKALKAAKKVKTVKVSTGSYQVYQRTLPRTKEQVWQAQQTLVLSTTEAADLLRLLQTIQAENFTMNQLNYRLSPEQTAETKEALIEKALVALQRKAKRIASALKKKHVELKTVNVVEQGHSPRPTMLQSRGMAMSAEMAEPVAEPGESTVSLTVSATAVLKP